MIRQYKVTNVSQIPHANVSLNNGYSYLQERFCPGTKTQSMEVDKLSSKVRLWPLKDKEILDESSGSYLNTSRTGWCELQVIAGMTASGMCIVLLNAQGLRSLIPRGST